MAWSEGRQAASDGAVQHIELNEFLMIYDEFLMNDDLISGGSRGGRGDRPSPVGWSDKIDFFTNFQQNI